MSDRPADIVLPEGWTWERVEAERARWEVSPDMIPDAVVPGNVTGWCTIAWYRWHRDHVPAGEVFAVSDRSALGHRAPLYLNEDLLGRLPRHRRPGARIMRSDQQATEIERFLSDRVVTAGAGALVSFRNMYDAYCEWVGGAAVAMLPEHFSNGMLALKYRHREAANGTRCWAGVMLKQPPTKEQILSGDVEAADQVLQQARLALDHFKSHNPA
ncbi:hypothetical protein [Inquilinus sp. CA228]|uniref:hypothetical protein n=1 Tax=Inquilinus sp. CA228 TaxID=3455609 RepID=UPI003F8CF433